MTRSAQIINTSNHEGEDLEVIIIDENGHNNMVLKPGDIGWINSYGPATVVSIPRTSQTPKPFLNEDGKQITPNTKVVWS